MPEEHHITYRTLHQGMCQSDIKVRARTCGFYLLQAFQYCFPVCVLLGEQPSHALLSTAAEIRKCRHTCTNGNYTTIWYHSDHWTNCSCVSVGKGLQIELFSDSILDYITYEQADMSLKSIPAQSSIYLISLKLLITPPPQIKAEHEEHMKV